MESRERNKHGQMIFNQNSMKKGQSQTNGARTTEYHMWQGGDIELDKAVVLVWLDWLVFCEYGFSVSALWCRLAPPTILLGFLLPWAWAISSRLLQQSAATAPYLGQGIYPHRRPSWPSTWDSYSRPFCACCSHRSLDVGLVLPAAASGLWSGVGPPGHRPWPPA